jgi:carbon starvation protein
VLGTVLTGGVPVFFVLQTMLDSSGRPVPLWKMFWSLFGASNQLLAALTLLGVTVWLWRTRRAWWVWPVAALPTAWMYVMSNWALARMIAAQWQQVTAPDPPGAAILILAISVVLVVLALLMLWEALLALLPRMPDDTLRSEPVSAPAAAAST